MRASRARFAAVAVVVAAVAAAPAGAEETQPVPPAVEAWHPSGLGAVSAPLRPADTLHVGTAAGQETDRTYLRFDLTGVPDGAEPGGARLTVPVSADAGTRAPESAVILACAVPGGVDGTGDEPPDVACDGAPTATFVPGDAPVFTVDLPPATGGTVDVALVPAGGDTWHVAFDSRHRDGAAPATLVVSYEPAPSAGTPPPATGPPPAPAPRTPAGGFATPAAPPLALPDLTPDPVAPGRAIADEADEAAPEIVTVVPAGGSSGFAYPAVFGLPLVLLVVLAVAGDGLTRPVRLREEAA